MLDVVDGPDAPSVVGAEDLEVVEPALGVDGRLEELDDEDDLCRRERRRDAAGHEGPSGEPVRALALLGTSPHGEWGRVELAPPYHAPSLV